VDGSKKVHAATIYWPDHPQGPPPAIDKEKDVFLQHRKNQDSSSDLVMWDLIQEDEILRSYNESDIRFALVYRARCFKDAEESARYQKVIDGTAPEKDMLRLPVCMLRCSILLVADGITEMSRRALIAVRPTFVTGHIEQIPCRHGGTRGMERSAARRRFEWDAQICSGNFGHLCQVSASP